MSARVKWIVGVCGLAVVALGVFLRDVPQYPGKYLWDIAEYAIPLSVGTLAAFWSALGGKPHPWRFVAAVVAAMGLVAWAGPPGEAGIFLGMGLFSCSSSEACCLSRASAGWRYAIFNATIPPPPTCNPGCSFRWGRSSHGLPAWPSC